MSTGLNLSTADYTTQNTVPYQVAPKAKVTMKEVFSFSPSKSLSTRLSFL
jgi:hypothetical protein